jgi:hypothetical protein
MNNVNHAESDSKILAAFLSASPKTDGADHLTPSAAFGIWVGSLRRQRGLSLAQAAGHSGLEVNFWLQVELGQASLLALSGALPALARTLGLTERALARRLAALLLP